MNVRRCPDVSSPEGFVTAVWEELDVLEGRLPAVLHVWRDPSDMGWHVAKKAEMSWKRRVAWLSQAREVAELWRETGGLSASDASALLGRLGGVEAGVREAAKLSGERWRKVAKGRRTKRLGEDRLQDVLDELCRCQEFCASAVKTLRHWATKETYVRGDDELDDVELDAEEWQRGVDDAFRHLRRWVVDYDRMPKRFLMLEALAEDCAMGLGVVRHALVETRMVTSDAKAAGELRDWELGLRVKKAMSAPSLN